MWGQRSDLKRLVAIAGATALVVIGALGIWSTTRSHSTESSPAPVAGAGAAGNADAARTGAAASFTIANAHRKSEPQFAAASLPPPGTPLVQIYDDLKARADAGDAAAASRLYRDVNRCVTAKGLPFVRSSLKAMAALDISKMSAEQISDTESMLGHLQDRLAEFEASERMCADALPEQRQLFPAALRAAQLGDLAATDCFILGPMVYASGLLDHPEWITQYRQNALELANAAVVRGDWRIVGQLMIAYSQPDFLDNNLFSQVTGTDLVMAYRYSKLMRLGNDPKRAAGASDEEEPPPSSAFSELSPEVIADADAWADDMYRRHFGGVPRQASPTNESGFCRSGAN